jgi:phosphatidate cytidylyltransferase
MDTNLRLRIGTAAVALPLLVCVIGWSPPWVFSALILLVTVGSLSEFFFMAFPQSPTDRYVGILFGLLLSALVFFDDRLQVTQALGLVLMIIFALYLLRARRLADDFTRLSYTLLGGAYAGLLLPQWVALFRQPHGRQWTFWILASVMSGDTFAFFIGRRFGARKLAPQLSPGKTVEGAWAYLGGAAIAGLATAQLLFEESSWTEILIMSLIVGILAQLGDLFESWIKRVFGVKDSGKLLPGHGGLLDRLDSAIFPAVFTAAYLRVFHP